MAGYTFHPCWEPGRLIALLSLFLIPVYFKTLLLDSKGLGDDLVQSLCLKNKEVETQKGQVKCPGSHGEMSAVRTLTLSA